MSAIAAFFIGGTLGAMAVVLFVNSTSADDNPYACYLGKFVEVDKFGDGHWEPCVVVAVSWKGGMKVRRLSEMDVTDVHGRHGNGFWVNKAMAPTRVRRA